MIGVGSYADKAVNAVARNQSALSRARELLAQHDNDRPAGDDAEVVFVWNRTRADLVLRVAAAEEALEFAENAADRARVEAAERLADAEHAAEEKRAQADVKLYRDIDGLVTKLVEKLREADASNARTAAVNERRGSRRFILDAETQVRQRPARVEPAIVEEREVWRSPSGETPTFYSTNEAGELIPAGMNSGAFRLVREKVVLREEQTIPARTPERLAEAVRLVDLHGEILWPR